MKGNKIHLGSVGSIRSRCRHGVYITLSMVRKSEESFFDLEPYVRSEKREEHPLRYRFFVKILTRFETVGDRCHNVLETTISLNEGTRERQLLRIGRFSTVKVIVRFSTFFFFI